MTELELKLLACLRTARRLQNQGVREMRDVANWHRTADRLLALQVDVDDFDQDQRYDAPHRVEHRKFVDRLFAWGRP